MLTASFIWLILSHAAVLLPITVGLIKNKRRWLPSVTILLFTAIISSFYHWYDKDGFAENELILNRNYGFYSLIDYYSSYLSIFTVVFYIINPRQKPEHLDISLILISLSCQVISLLSVNWYVFFIYVTLFCLFYICLSKKTDWRLIINNIFNHPRILLLAILFFVLAMYMQYYFCRINGAGYYYNIYHGFWHLFMFFSAGTLIFWNEKIRDNLVIDENGI